MKKLYVLLLVVVLSLPALADISVSNPVQIDIYGDGGNGPKAGWTSWSFIRSWTSPQTDPLGNYGAESLVGTASAFGSTANPPQGGRSRDGGMIFVAGTGEYAYATKGLGTHYLKISLSGLKPATQYQIQLWGYETHGTWSTNANNPQSKWGVWSTLNPMDWLSANWNGKPGNEGEPVMGGYGPKGGSAQVTTPVAQTDSNMPAAMVAAMGTSWGRFSLDQGNTDLADVPLGAWNFSTTFKFVTTPFVNEDYPGGTIDLYGWMDSTDFSGSMHMPLSGFRIVPEPTTIALLGLGGLALIRRKRA